MFIFKVVSFVVLIISAIIHEMAHGLAAEKLGDPTARSLGRITLNPIKHIDPFMTIILPGLLILSQSPVVFGGAKPVPVNPRYFSNPRRGMAIVAAAGPMINLILAGVGFLLMKLLALTGLFHVVSQSVATFIAVVFIQWIIINIVLAIFNLFPVPPLDGGRIVVGLLPRKLAVRYAQVERYGLLIVFFLLYMGVFDSYLGPVISMAFEGLKHAIENI